MGLFDKLMSGVIDGLMKNVDPATIPGLAAQYLGKTELGGVAGLLARLREAGLGREVDSWLGPGPNLPVSPEMLRSALGDDVLQQLTAATGMSVDRLLPLISGHMPQIVDQMSPNGRLEEPAPPSGDPSAR